MAHIHPLRDVDPNFVIDANSRTINDQSPTGTFLMQYDHNSEILTFEIPLKIEDHTMTDCDRVEIHFINIGSNGKKNPGVYPVENLSLKETDSETVKFSWLVSHEGTKYAGSLSFAIRFICTGNNNTAAYVWNTAVCNTITIGSGMDNSETIVTEYSDILGSWYNTFLSASAEGISDIEKATNNAIGEITEAARVLIKDLAVDEAMETVKQEIEVEKTNVMNAIHDQADNIANLVVDKLPSIVSPTITVAPIEGGHRVTITDVDGSETFDILNGTNTGGTGGSLTPEQAALLDRVSAWFDKEDYEVLTGTLTMNTNVTTYEIGSSQEVTFLWSFNKVPIEVTFNKQPQEAAQTGSDTVVISLQQNGSITCTLYGKYTDQETVTKEVTVKFRNRYYYGCSPQPTEVNSEFINSLPARSWAEYKQCAFDVDCGGGEYVWYAYPKRLGTAQMWQGGFQGGFEDPVSVPVTNGSGFTEDYYVYRSINSSLGKLAVEAK